MLCNINDCISLQNMKWVIKYISTETPLLFSFDIKEGVKIKISAIHLTPLLFSNHIADWVKNIMAPKYWTHSYFLFLSGRGFQILSGRINVSHHFYFLIKMERGFKILSAEIPNPLLLQISIKELVQNLMAAKSWTFFWLYCYLVDVL